MKFQEAFPDISLEYTGMIPSQYELRFDQERKVGQYLWDAAVNGLGTTVFSRQIPGGWLDPIKPGLILPEVSDNSKWLGGFDAGFMDKAKRYAYAFALYATRNTFVNRDLVPEAVLNKVEDFLDPRWKGKLAWYDPRVPGSGSATLTPLRKLLGDGGIKRLLVDQEPVITQDYRQLAEWLVRGRYPIGFGVLATEVTRFQREGVGLNVKGFVLPTEVATPGFGGVFLINRPPHPNAAKVFVNWMLGIQAQSAWAQMAAVNSRRLDAPAGDPEMTVEPKGLDRYIILQKEENLSLRVETEKLARSLLK
jgi:iron(III) transport system substrate-binding protein